MKSVSTVTVRSHSAPQLCRHHQRLHPRKQIRSELVPLPTGSFTGLADPLTRCRTPNFRRKHRRQQRSRQQTHPGPPASATPATPFHANGVDASNLFNGKSTSSVASARVVNNTGLGGSSSLSSTTADAAPELPLRPISPSARLLLPTLSSSPSQQFRVNTSMYDAQQGSTSGAHIDMSTKSGTNDFHGQPLRASARPTRSTPLRIFYNADPNIPA